MSRKLHPDDLRQYVRVFTRGGETEPAVMRPIQIRMVSDIIENHAACILGARQVGKTQAIAYVSSCYGLGVHPLTGEPIEADDVQIASATAKHSRDMLARVQKDLAVLGMQGAKPTEDARTGALRVKLANGREIMAHSGNPRSLQGFSGHTIVDELGATAHDPDEVYTSSMAATSGHADRRWVGIGNATYAGTWWHSLHTSQTSEWRTRRSAIQMSRYTIHDAHPDGLPPHLESMCAAFGGAGSAGWRRWFLCEWVEGFDRALTDDEILGCRYASVDFGRGAETVIGIDPGGFPNPTGVCVVRIGENGARVLHAEYWRTDEIAGNDDRRKAWTAEQTTRVLALMRRHRASRIVVDHSTLAAHLGDSLMRAVGAHMVSLVTTTTASRQRRWGLYLGLIREGLLEIPASLEDLYDDLRRAEIEQLPEGRRGRKTDEGGQLVLPQTPDDGDSGHILHCDVLDALLLTAEARLS